MWFSVLYNTEGGYRDDSWKAQGWWVQLEANVIGRGEEMAEDGRSERPNHSQAVNYWVFTKVSRFHILHHLPASPRGSDVPCLVDLREASEGHVCCQAARLDPEAAWPGSDTSPPSAATKFWFRVTKGPSDDWVTIGVAEPSPSEVLAVTQKL